jgi:hypothetical protein
VSIPDDPLVIAAMLRARLDEIDAVAISRALRIYGAAHARLLEQVMALIDSLGDPTQPVPSNALALASRAELLTQIETVLTRAGVQIEPTLIEARQQAVAVAMEAAEAMAGAQAADMRQKAELARDWAKLNERAVKELVESTADGEPLGRWLRELGPETRAAVEEKIERAVVESVNVGDLAEKLTREVDMSQRRALMVTRESSFGVQRRASEQQYRENRRLLRGKMRIEKIDEKTCRACLAHHGTIYPVDALVPRHVNCVVEGTRVRATGVVAAMRREYSGRVVELETMSGHRITVTPNHPLLTPKGWIAAGHLNEGDYLILDASSYGVTDGVDDGENVPPRVEEVVAALDVARGVVTVEMPSAAPDFHGDGIDSQVNVVWADCQLGDRVHSALSEKFGDRILMNASVRASVLASGSRFDPFFKGDYTASSSVMSSGGDLIALSGSHSCHPQLHDLRGAPSGNTVSLQTVVDNDRVNAVAPSDGVCSFSSEVTPYGIGLVHGTSRPSGGGSLSGREGILLNFAAEDPALLENSLETRRTKAGNCEADTLHSFTGNIAIDRIVNYVVRDFRGHVFNLETKDGFYSANGILTHNCRAVLAPVVRGGIGLEEPSVNAVEYLESLSEDQQRMVLGSQEGVEAWRSGEVELDDFSEVYQTEWGPQERIVGVERARANAARRRAGDRRAAD